MSLKQGPPLYPPSPPFLDAKPRKPLCRRNLARPLFKPSIPKFLPHSDLHPRCFPSFRG